MAAMHERLIELIKPVVAGLGYELWGLTFLHASHPPLLRVYIEHENGITLDDCEKVSRQVGRVLDVEEPIRGSFRLELSSPGLDRPLFDLSQYHAYCGETLSVHLERGLCGQRRFKGKLVRVENDTVFIESEGAIYRLPFADIEKAHVVPNFNEGRWAK